MAAFDPEAESFPGPKVWIGILLCMMTARSSAMAFNRLVDRQIDASNPRTSGRHLPSGRLSVQAVLVFTVTSAVLFVGSTALFLPENPWPIILSVPVLLWLLGYSYAKRLTSLAHYWLGSGLAISPIAAWIAVRGSLEAPPILLGVAVFFWVGGFDIIYACQDAQFDRESGLQSLPARLGIKRALRIAAISHFLMVVSLVLLGVVVSEFEILYWIGLIFIGGLLGYEHSLVRPDNLSHVNQAFFHVNSIISIGLLVIGVTELVILR